MERETTGATIDDDGFLFIGSSGASKFWTGPFIGSSGAAQLWWPGDPPTEVSDAMDKHRKRVAALLMTLNPGAPTCP